MFYEKKCMYLRIPQIVLVFRIKGSNCSCTELIQLVNDVSKVAFYLPPIYSFITVQVVFTDSVTQCIHAYRKHINMCPYAIKKSINCNLYCKLPPLSTVKPTYPDTLLEKTVLLIFIFHVKHRLCAVNEKD